MTWTVTYKYKPSLADQTQAGGTKAQPTPSPERVASIRTEKNGTLYHRITNYTTGARAETWSIGGQQACKAAHTDKYIYVTSNNWFYVDFSKSDFEEVSWIGKDNYVGLTGQDKKVFTFEAKNIERRAVGSESTDNNQLMSVLKNGIGLFGAKGTTPSQRDQMAKQDYDRLKKLKFGDTMSRAQLDVGTQFPLEYDDGVADTTYTYSSAPGPTSIAPEALQEMRAAQSRINASIARPSAP